MQIQEVKKERRCCMCGNLAVKIVPSFIDNKKTTELLCHRCYLINVEAEESYY